MYYIKRKVGYIMNICEMFNMVEDIQPSSSVEYSEQASSYEPTYTQPPAGWQDEFGGFKTRPVLYNMDGYISPYASDNWGGTSVVLKNFDDTSRLPSLSDKVDPNKIFTADISALKTLAADQIKITKMFEKKLMEGLTDRGKFGLNEADIMAMQALTSARSAITAINKEQIAIKKNIADLRIKQQNGGSSSSNTNGGSNDSTRGTRGLSSMDVGRSILDSIFDTPSNATPSAPPTTGFTPATTGDASRILDELIPSTSNTQFEASGATTYVVINDNDDNDVEFVTYDQNGDIIPDYPNPKSKITKIDRDTNVAVDELLVQYPIKYKTEIIS